MSLFFALVDDVCIGILSNWIETDSLTKLDSACCNRKDRRSLHILFHKDAFTTNTEQYNAKLVVFQWFALRQLKMRSITSAEFNISTEILNNLDVSQVTKLSMQENQHTDFIFTESLLIDFLSKCPKLTNLTGYSMSTQVLNKVLLSINILKQFNHIIFMGSVGNGVSLAVAQRICDNCKLLMSLWIEVEVSCAASVLTSIIRNNTALEIINIALKFSPDTFAHNEWLLQNADTVGIISAASMCNKLIFFGLQHLPIKQNIPKEITKLFKQGHNINTIYISLLKLVEVLDFNDTNRSVNFTTYTNDDKHLFVIQNADLCNCDKLIWQEFFLSIPKINIFEINQSKALFNPRMLKFISKKHPQLKKFQIRDNIDLNFDVLQRIFPQCDKICGNHICVKKIVPVPVYQSVEAYDGAAAEREEQEEWSEPQPDSSDSDGSGDEEEEEEVYSQEGEDGGEEEEEIDWNEDDVFEQGQ